MNNVYKITLNANNASPVITPLVFKQGDKGQKLAFTVEELDRTGATSAIIAFSRSNGTSVEAPLTAVDGGYEYIIQGNEFAVPGRVVADLKFYQGDTGRVSTTSFVFGVYDDTLDGLGGGAGGYSDVLEQLRDEGEAAKQSFIDATAEAMIYAQRAEDAAERAMQGTPEGYAAVVAQVGASAVNIQELKLLGWTTPKECAVQNEINGNVFTQKVGRVDLGSLTWGYDTTYGFFYSDGFPYGIKYCNKYEFIGDIRNVDMPNYNKVIANNYDKSASVKIRDTAYTTVSAFVSSVQGQYLYFELATPLTYSIADDGIKFDNAGAHNCRYRGKFLGTSVTTEQYAAISSGRFENLYIGDYWTIGGVNYRIAAFDYYLNCGNPNTTAHHVVIVPDTVLYNAQMNESNTSAGGYANSKMRTTNLAQAESIIDSAFSGHVLTHRIYITNAVASGRPSGGAWVDSKVDLMNEQMVYGGAIFSPISDGTNIPANYRVEKSQLPLFAHDPSRITSRANWWLRDVITAANFALVAIHSGAGYTSASDSGGVRPFFCIY